MWEGAAAESGVTIELQGGDAEVAADPVALRRVFMNLVENAVKYNRPGGRVRIRLEAENWHAWRLLAVVHVYVLWSASLRKRYVGSSSNVERRLKEHNTGGSRFTKAGKPWVLIHVETFVTITEARRREAELKMGTGRAWLDSLFPHTKRISK